MTKATGLPEEYREGVLLTTYTTLSLKRPRRGGPGEDFLFFEGNFEKARKRETISHTFLSLSLTLSIISLEKHNQTGGAARRSTSPSAAGGTGAGPSTSAPRRDVPPLLNGTRLQQVIEWCGGPGFDGCLVFDEAHKSKNLHPDEAEIDGEGDDGGGANLNDDDAGADADEPSKRKKKPKSTKTARVINLIQAEMPNARVMYCSATGISEVRNAGYLRRLGLWGPGTAFANFPDFVSRVAPRSVGFLELLSMSMKQEGAFVARGLGFRGAEFERLLCPVTEARVRRWNESSRLWERLWELDEGDGMLPGAFRSMYFGAMLRFYRSLLVSEKQEAVARAAMHARDVEGMSVVIGIQSTG